MKTTANRADRDRLLTAALHFTASQKGKARDRAIWDFLCGALWADHIASGSTEAHPACPPWLWVIGIRGGARVAEIDRMLAAKEPTE